MIAPTFEYLFSTSRVSWVENVIPPELSAMTPAIAAAIGVVVKLMMSLPPYVNDSGCRSARRRASFYH